MPLAGGWPNSEHLFPGDKHKHRKHAEESEVQPTNKWAVTTLSCVKIPTPLLDPPTHPQEKKQLRKNILIWEFLRMLFVPLFDGIMSFSLLSLPVCVQIKTSIRSVFSSSWTWMIFPSVGCSTFESLVNCWCFIWSPFLSVQSLILFLLWLYDPLHSI